MPHVTGEDFLDALNIPAGQRAAYALTSEDFSALAKSYGRLGGLDRIATVLKAIRAERGDRTRVPRRRRHLAEQLHVACPPKARTWSTAWRC